MSDNEKQARTNESPKKSKANSKKKDKLTKKRGSIFINVFILIIILFIWILIFILLVKLDVGGFGTTLRPVLKDITFVNKILPELTDEELAQEKNYPYASLADAMKRIDELEKINEELELMNEEYRNNTRNLEEELATLNELKEKNDDFKKRVLEFDRSVVFGDEAPEIEEYKNYYEAINPDNAEIIYRQVIYDVNVSQEIQEKADIYSQMDPKAAAKIFETLSNDTDLLLLILSNMSKSSASEILSEMNPELAGTLTKKLFND